MLDRGASKDKRHGHDQQRNDKVEDSSDQIDFKGLEAKVLDFLHRMGQLRRPDYQCEAAVLEQRDAVIDERWQRVTHTLRHDNEAHGREITMAECLGRFHLSWIDRTQTGAQILAEIGRLAEPETHYGKDRLGIMIDQPTGKTGRQKREDTKIPEH